MLLKSVALALALTAHTVHGQIPTNPPAGCCATAAMLRFACSQLTIDRIDPLVEPGNTPSGHLHQIVGGNSFNVSMEPVNYDPAKISTCTTCEFVDDFSNYWTANLYFRARNGSFKRVGQAENLYLNQTGGFTVYYIPPYDGKTNVTAFRPVRILIPIILLMVNSFHHRDSGCWLVTLDSARKPVNRSSCAIAAQTLIRIHSEVLLAQATILSICRRRCAPVVFVQRLHSQRE